MTERVVLRAPDSEIERWALGAGYILEMHQDWDLRGERTLFVAPGARMPRDLLKQGFRLLERWDVAVPLWRYGVLAKDIGTEAERERTKAIVLDLRVLLYAHEVLFVRPEGDGERFIQAWRGECVPGANERLAFLRALHAVKPLVCTLPQEWVARLEDGPAAEPRRRVPAEAVWMPKERVERRERGPAIRPPVRRR